MITVVTSLENEKVKKYKKLQQKKYRDKCGQYIVEGEHLVFEAYKSGVIQELILLEGVEINLPVPYGYYSAEVMKKISTMDTPSTVMALCNKCENDDIVGNKFLLLDGIQDPGNLGTIIRSAVAFNIDSIILTENTVDVYNPKVLRATQGMIFYINIITMDAVLAMTLLKQEKVVIYGTKVTDGIDVRELEEDEKRRFALVLGNEGSGVREEISDVCDKNLYIKMNKNTESLNVAIAASILMYELGR